MNSDSIEIGFFIILGILAFILLNHAVRNPKAFLVSIFIEIPFGVIERLIYELTFHLWDVKLVRFIKKVLRIQDKPEEN